MHAIQEELVTVEALTDNELVEMVLNSWKTVCDENESQRHLVTDSQWNQWQSYKQHTTNRLNDAIKGHENDTLAEGDRKVFLSVASEIARAGHKTEPELIEEARRVMRENEQTAEAVLPAGQKRLSLKEKWKAALAILLKR